MSEIAMPAGMIDRRGFALGLGGALLAPASASRGATGEPVETPIALEDGRVWIAASINGSEPMLFVVDTGGALQLIDSEVARRLKLTILGGSRIGGLGKGGVAQGGLVLARALRFSSGLVQPQTVFTTTDLKLGRDAAGSLAAGLFTAQDSELDFDAGMWRVWRDGRPAFDGLTRMTATIAGGERGTSPQILATVMIDGKPYRMVLDTGAHRITLYPRAAARSGLWDPSRPFVPVPTVGVAGLASKPSRLVRARRLEMNPLAIDAPIVTLMDPDQTMKQWDHDGLIGLPALELLTLATDVRHRSLYARRNGRQLAAERYPGSGVWLDQGSSGQAVVGQVGTGSPAAEAGLKVGDVIVEPPTFSAALRAMQQLRIDIAVRTPAGVERRRFGQKLYL